MSRLIGEHCGPMLPGRGTAVGRPELQGLSTDPAFERPGGNESNPPLGPTRQAAPV